MGAIKLRRHGDVMIKTYEGFKIPDSVKLEPVRVLHGGNNHDHFFASGKPLVGEMEGKRFLKVVEDAVIDHEEHGKGDIPQGDYYVEIKQEYDHFLEESRQIQD